MILEGLHEKELFSENYPFRLAVNTEENFDYPLHWHNAVELVYALENSFHVIVNNREYKLGEKDILFIPCGDIHGFQGIKNKGKRVFIQFDICMLTGFGGFSTVTPYLSQPRRVSYSEDQSLHSLIEDQILKIINEYEKKDYAYALFLNARIYDILVLLSRSLINKINEITEKSSIKRVYGLEKLNAALKFVEENYQSTIALKSISKAVGFSEYHFSRIFKEITGKNFHSYLSEYRVRKAENLLAACDMSVTEIAHAVGFNSIATFNRVFKDIKGCPPSLYKKIRA